MRNIHFREWFSVAMWYDIIIWSRIRFVLEIRSLLKMIIIGREMCYFIVDITCVLVGLQVQSDVYCLRWLLVYLQYGPGAARVSALLRPPVPIVHELCCNCFCTPLAPGAYSAWNVYVLCKCFCMSLAPGAYSVWNVYVLCNCFCTPVTIWPLMPSSTCSSIRPPVPFVQAAIQPWCWWWCWCVDVMWIRCRCDGTVDVIYLRYCDKRGLYRICLFRCHV